MNSKIPVTPEVIPNMEVIFTIVAYLFVLGSVLFLPFMLFLTVLCFWDNKKRLALLLAGALLGAELLCGGILYFRPFYSCPEIYAPYISEEQESRLKAGHGPAARGFWSGNIPSLAVFNKVTYASEHTIHVRTFYFPWGSSETGVSSDGLFPVY